MMESNKKCFIKWKEFWIYVGEAYYGIQLNDSVTFYLKKKIFSIQNSLGLQI